MRPLVFRPLTGVVVSVVFWIIAVMIVVSLLASGQTRGAQLWPIAPAAVAVAWLTWVLLWWPCVRIAGEGVLVRNPLRTVRIAWPELRDADSRGSLLLTTSAGTVTAWAVPPPYTSMRRRANDALRARSRVAPVRADVRDAPDDADVADTIRRIQSGRYLLPTTGAPYRGVSTRWNVAVIAVSVVVVAMAVVRLLV